MKLFALAGILALASANAQEFSRFTADFGVGYTAPVGSTSQSLDWGWNIRGGAGVNFSPYLGTNLNLGYDSMGINNTALSNLGVSGGGVHIFHATVDPVVHLTPRSHVDFYLTGGGGLFHLYQDYSSPVVPSWSVNKPGFDVGGGVAIGAFGHGKFLAESRWDHMFLSGGHADFLPVTFGFRW